MDVLLKRTAVCCLQVSLGVLLYAPLTHAVIKLDPRIRAAYATINNSPAWNNYQIRIANPNSGVDIDMRNAYLVINGTLHTSATTSHAKGTVTYPASMSWFSTSDSTTITGDKLVSNISLNFNSGSWIKTKLIGGVSDNTIILTFGTSQPLTINSV